MRNKKQNIELKNFDSIGTSYCDHFGAMAKIESNDKTIQTHFFIEPVAFRKLHLLKLIMLSDWQHYP
jgi:hypothetical protein